MSKIVFFGAGSAFSPRLFKDIMLTPGIDGGEYCLVDVDAKRLGPIFQLCKKIAAKLRKDKKWKIVATTRRREVMRDADYLINCIEVSGMATVRIDNDIPLKYGVKQCIGDTIGPGGIFKAMRTVPAWLDILADAERLCPNAHVLNYTNPMSIMMLAANRASSLPMVGLCHSVQGSSKQLASYAKVPYDEMRWTCAGINHTAWFVDATWKGQSVYPRVFQNIKDPEMYEKDPVRFDMMLHFGAYVTESSGHNSEYNPYYRKRDDLITRYCREGYRGGTSFYADCWPKWRADMDASVKKQVAGKEKLDVNRSHEYAASIIAAINTDQPAIIYGTVPNRGLIENLRPDGVVEVAVTVNGTGFHPTRFGRLPDQMAAVNNSNMAVYELAAQACLERDFQKAEWALMVDPLTAAVCCPAEIRKMFREMAKAQSKFLNGFTWRS